MIIEACELFKKQFIPLDNQEGSFAISSLTGSSDAFAAISLSHDSTNENPRVVLVISSGLPQADKIVDDLKILTAKMPHRICEFPPLLPDDKSALGTRLKTIAAIRAWEINPYPCIVVVASATLAQPISIKKTEFITIKKSSSTSITLTELSTKLANMGYSRISVVEKEGDYSIRGGILDVWSPGEEFPTRAEFFGDDLESIRSFNPSTQRSIDQLKEATFIPICEKEDDLNSSHQTLLDILPENTALLITDHINTSLPKIPTSVTCCVYAGDPPPENIKPHKFQTSPLPGFSELGADEAHHPELFDAAKQRLERHIASAQTRGDIIIQEDELSGGFEIPGLLVVTKSDRIFTKRKVRLPRINNASSGAQISQIEDLEPGEYVVHLDYGIGRFLGSSEIQMSGKRCEVFTIEYEDEAKLHVPVTHAHLISRYVGVKGEQVKLHRLDGKRWTKDKADAQKAVADLASSLLETQAKRELVPGYAYNIDCDGHDAFAAAFPYEETQDQKAAISAIEHDLSCKKPMDRLICGDAGYGKTEVAMRAAYIVAMNGRQTAVLAPTTVLAEQHFETFTSRFEGTPIRIEAVSRFQSKDTHNGTFKRLETGACDIVIGTHAILSSKIAFHDLGLIIIDEEQRFGVRHKEFLKRLRETADVLTMSATPIPRTLYLSMTGAREMSLLRTPPRIRVAVETQVVRDSDEIIYSSIKRELERGGQVFFLHNRVATINKVEKRLHAILPKVRIVVAHGQMEAKTLARKMRDFESGKYDILLSTTIIESGIDIPRANTIIVSDAHRFGLADLYQLRGRVGRAARQGHAIFLLPSDAQVDHDARERLDALKRHGGLGAGFNLAVRDLELRGAGNLLGAQQSGHITAVGFRLYCQLLQRTVALLKGEKVDEIIDVRLSLDFIDPSPASEDDKSSASIPYTYIEEDSQRLMIMKRIAETMKIKDIKNLEDELLDRFGPIPKSTKRLLRIAELRVQCAQKRINCIYVKDTLASFYRCSSRDVAFVRGLSETSADKKIAELIKIVNLEG